MTANQRNARMSSFFGVFAIGVIAITAAACGARAQETASVDDTARFLAGMAPSPRSPLAAFAREPAWRKASASFTAAWRGLDESQIPKIRAWSKKNLHAAQTLLYMFSGPDFIYADAFFPNAETYVLAGLEPVGEIPDILALPISAREHALGCARAPFKHFQNYGVFLTAELDPADESCEFKGNLPHLLIALAHSGKAIRAIEFVEIDPDGALGQGRSRGSGSTVEGVKIALADQSGRLHTLYYFSANLSNAGIGSGAFLKFFARIGRGAALLKAASYLLHDSSFSQARNFLLGESTVIVQDDSGIPLRYFELDEWLLRPFGDYRIPVRPFQAYAQPDLRALFHSDQPQPLEFGFGYPWRNQEANLLLAIRRKAQSGR